MSNVKGSTIINNQIPAFLKESFIASDIKKPRAYAFEVTTPPQDGSKKITPDILQSLKFEKKTFEVPHPSVIIIHNHIKSDTSSKDEEDDDEEDVSQDFVTNFNEHIGNSKNVEKAQRLIEKMCRLGGLIPAIGKQTIDIPSARLGFSILAGLNNSKYKMDALDNLQRLLEKDKLEKETSIHLVNLAISLMKQMNRELMQTEIIDVQIKITHVYSLVAELLQRHYSKKHINAITKELKIELIETSKALEALNRQDNPRLDFYVNFALEGVRRLVDDRKELFDLIERFYHAMAAIAIMASPNSDAATSLEELAKAFEDLDPHLPKAWYNGTVILNALAKDAKTDPAKLTCLQVLLQEKWLKFDWKFLYAALEILLELSLQGLTPHIRKTAFRGFKDAHSDLPGLLCFSNSKDFAKYTDFSPMLHFKSPHRKDPNIIIRQACAENLVKIAQESPDLIVRKGAKLELIRRLRLEKDAAILGYLKTVVPARKEDQNKWIQEPIVRDPNVVYFHLNTQQNLGSSRK